MFYCMDCAEKKGWPETLFKSKGPCEVCLKVKVCNDLPSRDLPVAQVRPIRKVMGLD